MRSVPVISALIAMLFTGACGTGTSTTSGSEDTVRITGIVEVLHAGTRSETVILTENSTGKVYALVGDLAYDLVPDYGMNTSVLGRITEEGYSVREDLEKVFVIDYSFVDIDEPEDY